MSSNDKPDPALLLTHPAPSNLAMEPPNTRFHACLRCQQRKIKCNGKEPCSNCTKASAECIPAASLPPRRRKKRFPEADLLTRLRRYEEALKRYGVDTKMFDNDGAEAGSKTRGDTTPVVQGEKWANRGQENSLGDSNSLAGLKNEFMDTEELLQGSFDDEIPEAPITKTWDTMVTNNPAVLLFGSQHTQKSLTSLHPRPMDIMKLWQIFVDNVNPLTKVVHAPTLQQQLIDTSANLGGIPKDMEALLFSIYLLSIMSIDDERCEKLFSENRSSLIDRYQFGSQQALLNAEFLRPSTIVALQALLLYILSIRKGVNPRSLSCLTGVTLRLGQQMGLHRDGIDQNRTPFEIEMRRRLWWQILLIENRIAEFSCVGTSIITHQWTTRMPLNVNDSDLYPDMRDFPREHNGATEMIFCLTRCEVAEFLRRVRSSTTFDGCWYELSTSQISLGAKSKAIDELEQLLEEKYLKQCDSSIPLHLITSLMTKSAVCKLKHIAHHPRLLSDRGTSLSQDKKDKFFSWSLQMIEWSNILESDQKIQRFIWYTIVNKPLEGYIHVLSELKYRATGDLAERAWPQVFQCFNHWFFLRDHDGREKHSLLFVAVANLAAKAWESRAQALRQSQPFASPPEVISQLQNYLHSWRLRRSETICNKPTLADSRDIWLGESHRAESTIDESRNPVETCSSEDLSMLADYFPMDDPVDWAYWSDIPGASLLTDVESQGGIKFSMI